jgi:hypothetical protein
VSAAVELPAPPPAGTGVEVRTVGRVVELASGLLMLLDEHGITGQLPVDTRVQASRLRHAVKAAVRTSAGGGVAPPPAEASAATVGGQLRAWIAAQPWAQQDQGPAGWCYLLHFVDPATGTYRPYRS